MFSGIAIGATEISLYIGVCMLLRKIWPNLNKIDTLSYYWFVMTILTFIWELSFISQYNHVHNYAQQLINSSEHVWTNTYNLSSIIPWKLSPWNRCKLKDSRSLIFNRSH